MFYVKQQLICTLMIACCASILNHLDEDGFLTAGAEIARYHRLPSEIEDVIAILKRCDPIGLFFHPGEAMLAQIESRQKQWRFHI